MVYRAKDGIWGIWVIHGICRCLIKSMILHSPRRVCVCAACAVHTEHAVSLYTLQCCCEIMYTHTIAPCADKYVCIFYGNI